MTWRALLSESWRTFVTGTSRAVMWIVLTTCVVAGAAIADIEETAAVSRAAQEYVSQGGSVTVLTAPGRIDGAACEALNRVPGVRGAGAIAHDDAVVTMSALPSAPIPISDVTVSFPRLLSASAAEGAGVYISEEVADDLPHGAAAVSTPEGDRPIVGIFDYPEDGRAPGLGYAVLSPTVTRHSFDACWVDVWPQSDELTHLVMMAVLPESGAEVPDVTMSALNPTLPLHFDGRERLEHRITRWLPIMVLFITAGLGGASIRLRRLELASDLHAGLCRRDLWRLVLCDTLLWFVPASLWAMGLIAGAIALTAAVEDSALRIVAARSVWASVCGVGLGAAVGTAATREKYLFAWSKDR